MMKIVVTECDHDTFDAEDDVVRESGAEFVIAQSKNSDEVIANSVGAVGILVQYASIGAEIMDALPDLRVIGRYGVGVDSIDVEAASARGIAVCNVPDYGTESVSDHAIGLALSVARGIPRLDRGVRAGAFDLVAVRPLYQTAGRVFGVIGVGLIGTATARKAKGLGYEVIGYDIKAAPGEVTFHGAASVSLTELLERSQVISLHVPLNDETRHMIGADQFAQMRPDALVVNTSRGDDIKAAFGEVTFHGAASVSLAELLERSQVISLHVPLNDETRHMIGAEQFAQMRPDALVVNTSRGGVIDTEALVEALRARTIAGAAIDVHEQEPVPVGHPLMGFDSVVLTPHLAWYSEESYGELKRRTAQNVVDVAAGRAPRNIVNPEVLGAPGGRNEAIAHRKEVGA